MALESRRRTTSISSGSARSLGTGDLAGEGPRLLLWFAVAGVRKNTRQTGQAEGDDTHRIAVAHTVPRSILRTWLFRAVKSCHSSLQW